MDNHTIVIAEAGVNHNGSIDMAKQLIDAASEAGVDYVKFQTFKAGNLVTKSAAKAEYQKRNIDDNDNSQYAMLKKLELSSEWHFELIDYCTQRGKIPSGEITNYPYLKKIASFCEPVILSTGMGNLEEIEAAIDVLIKFGMQREQITILHCNTEYPTPFEDVNLRAMLTIKEEFGVKVGYSDHTRGIEVPIAAVALGAKVIEKHFTLDRNLPGPDHQASLEPDELKAMVDSIRNIEKALGDGEKKVTSSEGKNIAIARKSIVAACPIRKGEIFSEKNLTVKRPGTGINPMRWEEIVGTIAIRDYNEDELIEL